MFPSQIPWDVIPSILSDIKSGKVSVTTATNILWLIGCALATYGKPSFATSLETLHTQCHPSPQKTEVYNLDMVEPVLSDKFKPIQPLETDALPGGPMIWVLIGRILLSVLLGSKGQ